MAFKFAESPEGYSDGVSLFNLPPVDAATNGIGWQNYHPTSLLAKHSPIEFHIPGTSDKYIDLKKTRLYVKVRILKADGTPVDANSKVTFINLTLQSF
jgi:hypothetical protein